VLLDGAASVLVDGFKGTAAEAVFLWGRNQPTTSPLENAPASNTIDKHPTSRYRTALDIIRSPQMGILPRGFYERVAFLG
jgi:hypothetical protein